MTFQILACGKSENPAPAGATSAPATKPVIGFLNTAENQQIASGTFVSGWALSESGIADVSVKFDDGQRGYVRTGADFPGVKEQFPTYPDKDKAGYIFAIPKLAPGPHTLMLTVSARDGGTMEIRRAFLIP
jgi:hypothetical protein